MTIIPISDVAPGKLYDPLDVDASVRRLLAKPVEAMACQAERLVSCDNKHAFVKAAHDAFYHHHPLVIRPDDIWFCIVQGFATYVGKHQEALRSRMVTHAGKKTLTVVRPDFSLGQPNPWPEVFETFSSQIGEYVGELKNILSARFSTTTPVEIAAFDVCLMDTFQGYFEYEIMCGCGIPEIMLEGTADDWRSIIVRVKQLTQYGLAAWSKVLIPILEKIADSAAGKADKEFWRSFFRYQSISGSGSLTGWILTLFPYVIVDWKTGALGENPYLSTWQKRFELADQRATRKLYDNADGGPDLGVIPGGLVSAPVRCGDIPSNKTHDMRFVAGMFGVQQNAQTRALKVAFGWAVIYP